MGGREPTEEQWRRDLHGRSSRTCWWPARDRARPSVMAARVVYLALAARSSSVPTTPGVLPGNVLCLTFTNKATENLQQRDPPCARRHRPRRRAKSPRS
mgnify:CR=1 FL=1